jgi:hypothetical protein
LPEWQYRPAFFQRRPKLAGSFEYDPEISQHFQALSKRLKMIHFPSWPGFVPAIHVFLDLAVKDVDARHKAGHDEFC